MNQSLQKDESQLLVNFELLDTKKFDTQSQELHIKFLDTKKDFNEICTEHDK